MRCAFKLGVIVLLPIAAACSIDHGLSEDLIPPDTTDNVLRVVASLAVSPAEAILPAGETLQLTVAVLDSSGGEINDRVITWESTALAVASVSADGLVTAGSAGSTVIRATSDGKSDSSVVTVVPPEDEGPRVGFYVAPNGTSGADGTFEHPWNLATGLAGAGGRVGPGDTIWLRGGTYPGRFRSLISGEPGRPVVVRQYPGERAIIDGATGSGSVFYVGGEWSVFWGFEITNTNTVRVTESTRPNVLVNYASHTKYINLIVHDGGVAFYTEPDYADVEIAGCIFYNNGRQGSDRGHGHALYLKSYAGSVVARDNVMFNQFGYGVHVYSNAGSGELRNITIEGNVAFNNGSLATNSYAANILVGGDDYATGDVVRNNIAYFSPSLSVAGANVKIGYGSLKNGSVELRDNYVVGGAPVLEMGYWSSASIRGNTFVGTGSLITLNDPVTGGHIWSGDVHHRDPSSTSWRYDGSSYTFNGWRNATGLASLDQALSGLPAMPHSVVRPNPYEAGRGTVAVVNWGREPSVPVDLSGVLPVGSRYEIRNVQALFGAPVTSGTFTGAPVLVPMGGVTPPAPVGFSTSRAPRTGPDFDVFLVTKR